MARDSLSAQRTAAIILRAGSRNIISTVDSFLDQATGKYELVPQAYVFFAVVCSSLPAHGISCLNVNIIVDVRILRTAK